MLAARKLQKKRGKGHKLIDYAANLERLLEIERTKRVRVALNDEQLTWLQGDAGRWAFWLEIERNMNKSGQVDLSNITAYRFFNRNQRKYLADGLKARKIATLSRQGDGGTLTLWRSKC